MCASNNYSQKENILSRKQYQSSQKSTYRSLVTTDDTGYYDGSDDDECSQNIGSTISQRSSAQQEYNSRRHLTGVRFSDSPIVSPSTKRKHNEISTGEALILEKLDYLIENLTTMDESNSEKMKKMFKSQQKMQKHVYKLAQGQKVAAATAPLPEQFTPVHYKGQNLFQEFDMNQTPTFFLCKLIRQLYTTEEIEERVVHDDRMTAIKKAVRTAYYPDDEIKFDLFWKTAAHLSLQGQRRSQKSRTRKREHVNGNHLDNHPIGNNNV